MIWIFQYRYFNIIRTQPFILTSFDLQHHVNPSLLPIYQHAQTVCGASVYLCNAWHLIHRRSLAPLPSAASLSAVESVQPCCWQLQVHLHWCSTLSRHEKNLAMLHLHVAIFKILILKMKTNVSASDLFFILLTVHLKYNYRGRYIFCIWSSSFEKCLWKVISNIL